MPEITLVILVFKSFNELGLVAYTTVFTCPHKKNLMESNLANVEANGMVYDSENMKMFFTYLKIVANFVVKNYSITILKTRFIKL